MKNGTWIMIAGIFAFVGVALGAFGAHALSERFGDYEKGIWQTATFYHLVHSVALFAFGMTVPALSPAIGWLFSIGILLFSGSLYAPALSGVKILGAVTPFGGLAFLAAWAMVARAGFLMSRSGN